MNLDEFMPYLASDRVEFLGQPVFLLAGPNETVVRRLASKTVLECASADEAAKVVEAVKRVSSMRRPRG
jgi:xanthine dehydrogenase molybdopterin-binding subunit B